MLKIAVDAMGGDNAPVEIVKGALAALDEREDFMLVFTGDENLVKAELAKYKYDASRVDVRHCTEVVTNDDIPTSAVRRKRDSSLVVGLKMLKEDENVGGFVSAGPTGALFAGGVMYLGRIKGVMRPALCPGVPNVRVGQTLLCDCGANAECKPAYLAQFGLMASAYARILGVEEPRVGLLSNGTEEHKGDPLHQEAHALLKEMKGVRFVGNVEGRDLMYGDVDVVVSDGFSGNIALKSAEGCGKAVSALLNQEFKKSLFSKISYLFVRGKINKLKSVLDYARIGGTLFLGLKSIVVKSHGASKARSITPSVVQAVDAYRGNLIQKIEEAFAAAGVSGSEGE